MKMRFGLVRRRRFLFIGLATALTLALVLPAVQVYRDCAYADRNTGSRKGYREWSLGPRSGSWYKESAIETFMRSNHSDEFQQDWVSYAGTGRNIFGGATQFGHSDPGPIIFLQPEEIDRYCRSVSDSEKLRLYRVFASGDREKIRGLVDDIPQTLAGMERAEELFREHPGCQTTYNLVLHEDSAAVPLILEMLDRLGGEANAETRWFVVQGALWRSEVCGDEAFLPVIQRGMADSSARVRSKTASMVERARAKYEGAEPAAASTRIGP